MSEIKLCPKSFNQPMVTGKGIYDCVQEKCAWWIEPTFWGPADDVANTRWDYIKVPGHCVALDWGKK